jgi:hypothetical protein
MCANAMMFCDAETMFVKHDLQAVPSRVKKRRTEHEN